MTGESLALDESVTLKKLQGIKVRFPDVPTDLHVVLARHGTAEDVPPNIREYIEAVDVVLLEGAAPSEEVEDGLQAISDGDSQSLKRYRTTVSKGALFSGFTIRMTEALFDSQKPVQLCDIPYTQKNIVKYERMSLRLDGNNLSTYDRFRQDILGYYNGLIQEGLFERDKFILRNVYPKMMEPFSQEAVTAVRGLFVIGISHRTIPHTLKAAAKKADRPDQRIHETYYGSVDKVGELYIDFLQGQRPGETELLKAFLMRNRNLAADEQKAITEADVNTIEQLMRQAYDEAVAKHSNSLAALLES